MACGVHLGILLICLVQAEHVCCLWATQARRQNGKPYVGFSQQGSGFGGSYPQSELRQASGSPGSVQGSSLNKDTVSGYSQRFPSSGNTQTLSQSAKSSYDSVRLVQSSSESKPNWQKMPKKQLLGPSASISGGSSLRKYTQTPMSTDAAESRRIPVRTKTSASAPARRVSSRRSSAASNPSPFSSRQNERTRNNPSQTENWKPYSSKLVPVNARNLPASRTSTAGTSGQGFGRSTTLKIPQSFGGYAIRRLKEPAGQKKVSVNAAPQRPSLPQQAYAAPQRPSLPQQAYAAPQRPSLPQQAYVAPQRPSSSYKPQVQSVYPEVKWRIKPDLGQ